MTQTGQTSSAQSSTEMNLFDSLIDCSLSMHLFSRSAVSPFCLLLWAFIKLCTVLRRPTAPFANLEGRDFVEGIFILPYRLLDIGCLHQFFPFTNDLKLINNQGPRSTKAVFKLLIERYSF